MLHQHCDHCKYLKYTANIGFILIFKIRNIYNIHQYCKYISITLYNFKMPIHKYSFYSLYLRKVHYSNTGAIKTKYNHKKIFINVLLVNHKPSLWSLSIMAVPPLWKNVLSFIIIWSLTASPKCYYINRCWISFWL